MDNVFHGLLMQVMLADLAAHWKAMGFLDAMPSAEKLLSSIDYDGSKQLTWSKFQAVAALVGRSMPCKR